MPNGAPTTPSNGYLTIKDTIIPKILTNMIINRDIQLMAMRKGTAKV